MNIRVTGIVRSLDRGDKLTIDPRVFKNFTKINLILNNQTIEISTEVDDLHRITIPKKYTRGLGTKQFEFFILGSIIILKPYNIPSNKIDYKDYIKKPFKYI